MPGNDGGASGERGGADKVKVVVEGGLEGVQKAKQVQFINGK